MLHCAVQRIPSFLNRKAEIWFVSDKCYLFYLVQHFPYSSFSLLFSRASSFSLGCSYFVVKSNCQIDSTFCLFARFSPNAPCCSAFPVSLLSLFLFPSLFPLPLPLSHAGNRAEPQIIEWFEFLYWICCCLIRSMPSPSPSASTPTLRPHGFSIFSLLCLFSQLVFSLFCAFFFCVDIFFY